MTDDDDRAALDYQAQLEERHRRQAEWDQWATESKHQFEDEIARRHEEFLAQQQRLEDWVKHA